MMVLLVFYLSRVSVEIIAFCVAHVVMIDFKQEKEQEYGTIQVRATHHVREKLKNVA